MSASTLKFYDSVFLSVSILEHHRRPGGAIKLVGKVYDTAARRVAVTIITRARVFESKRAKMPPQQRLRWFSTLILVILLTLLVPLVDRPSSFLVTATGAASSPPPTTTTATAKKISFRDREPCKEAVCASVVSKCLLIDACKCKCGANVTSCSCARNCFQCLDFLFTDCCDCVKMCPTDTIGAHEDHTSQVGDLPDAYPVLFKALTDDVDPTLRWVSYTFVESNRDGQQAAVVSVTTNVDGSGTTTTTETSTTTTTGSSIQVVTTSTPNCTVAFMSQCTSWNKCRQSCRSIGAAKYRWFHDGCCECVGSTCFGYGLGEAKCLDCSPYSSSDAGDDDNRLTDSRRDDLVSSSSPYVDSSAAESNEQLPGVEENNEDVEFSRQMAEHGITDRKSVGGIDDDSHYSQSLP